MHKRLFIIDIHGLYKCVISRDRFNTINLLKEKILQRLNWIGLYEET